MLMHYDNGWNQASLDSSNDQNQANQVVVDSSQLDFG